jgi:ribosomal protein S18 acetylase RimI-like enzyme
MSLDPRKQMPVDEISLLPCTFEHAAALAAIGSATFLEAFAGILEGSSIVMHCQKQHSVAAYEKYLAHPDTRAWLAVVQPGDAPVGYAMLTAPDLPLDDISPSDLELKRIYLFSRFRGTGAAALLFHQALQAAREAGKARLLLGVHAENHRALAFYRKHGFEKVGVRTFQIGAMIYDDLVLGREIGQ